MPPRRHDYLLAALVLSLMLHAWTLFPPDSSPRHHSRRAGRGGSAREDRSFVEFGVVQSPKPQRAGTREPTPLTSRHGSFAIPSLGAALPKTDDAPGKTSPNRQEVSEGQVGSKGDDVASLAQQRVRLPEPVHCPDPIAGVWASSQYHHDRHAWRLFTLTIHRAPEGALAGTMVCEFWNGRPEQSRPPNCADEVTPHAIVTMSASGNLEGRSFEFGGDEVLEKHDLCGRPPYNIDDFTGTLDPAHDELPAMESDTGDIHDFPTLFRRVACE